MYFDLLLFKVLGQYIENLMSASSVFQPANPDSKKRYEQCSEFCLSHCLCFLGLSKTIQIFKIEYLEVSNIFFIREFKDIYKYS